MSESKCPIWGTPATFGTPKDHGNQQQWHSPRAGGCFVLMGTALPEVCYLSDNQKVQLTNWIIDQNRLGGGPASVSSRELETIKTYPQLSVMQRRDRLLWYLEQRVKSIGEWVEFAGIVTEEKRQTQLEILAWTASLVTTDYQYLIKACKEEELVEVTGSPTDSVRLTTRGHHYLSELGLTHVASEQAFIAMWFHPQMEEAYEKGIVPAVVDSGYRPMRIDRKEHVNKIDDEIVAEIRRSRFLIADFTSEPEKPRGGVYFEAGFAHGINIPVIWTCRREFIDKIHFDTRQFNHIDWSNSDDLYQRLKNRIGAVIGDGPLKRGA